AHRGSTDAAWYLEQIGALGIDDLYEFIRFDVGRLHPQPPKWNPSVALMDIGHAALRDGLNEEAPSLFFKAGPYENNIGHNHYDHNAFVISHLGEWVMPDRGYHSFYDPAKRKFSLGSLGHNTVVLDVDDAYLQSTTVPHPGHEQVQRVGGRIAAFFGGELFDAVRGEAAAAYNAADRHVLDRFDRTILYIKPGFFVIHDELAAPEPHRFSLLLHADAQSVIQPQDDAFTITRTAAEVYSRVASAVPTTARVETSPGAESYGSYLRVETEPAATTRFTTLLYPRPNPNPVLIRNTGFEQGMPGWRPRSNEDLPNHTVVAENPAEGAQCGRIESSGYYYSDYFRRPVGEELTVRAKVRTTALPEGEGATMTLYFWREGKAFASKRVGPFAHEDWQEHAVTETVPEGTEQVCLALEFFAPGVGWFDDVQIDAELEKPQVVTPEVHAIGADGIDVTLGTQRHLVSFGAAGAAREYRGLGTDGKVAALTLDAEGRAIAAFVQEGASVSWDGREVLRLELPGTGEARLPG
ncbi:MAG: hypothetical protein FJX74_25800, partial [Armatimonadetes bacterium]|nr:hypothetical protein [Armatimonadota bacterium]